MATINSFGMQWEKRGIQYYVCVKSVLEININTIFVLELIGDYV